MITLSIIIILWGLYSTYKTYQICEKKDEPFNLFEGSYINFIGFLFGLAVLLTWVLRLTITYLP